MTVAVRGKAGRTSRTVWTAAFMYLPRARPVPGSTDRPWRTRRCGQLTKRLFLRHSFAKAIVLSRHARDVHQETTETRRRFCFAGPDLLGFCAWGCGCGGGGGDGLWILRLDCSYDAPILFLKTPSFFLSVFFSFYLKPMDLPSQALDKNGSGQSDHRKPNSC